MSPERNDWELLLTGFLVIHVKLGWFSSLVQEILRWGPTWDMMVLFCRKVHVYVTLCPLSSTEHVRLTLQMPSSVSPRLPVTFGFFSLPVWGDRSNVVKPALWAVTTSFLIQNTLMKLCVGTALGLRKCFQELRHFGVHLAFPLVAMKSQAYHFNSWVFDA